MAFNSCDAIDTFLGYSLMVLAGLLSVFVIDNYNKMSDTDKSNRVVQFTISVITLVISVVYFLYMIKDPFMSLISGKR